MGFPGSSCLIIVLWAQKVMRYIRHLYQVVLSGYNMYCIFINNIFYYSLDRFLLAVIWTLGILSFNQTDDKDIKYVAKQIEKKKIWMYYSETITVSPLK